MATVERDSSTVYRVADLVVDPGARRVTRDECDLDISGLTFDFLLALVEAAPSVASFDRLAEDVWSGRPVTPETLTQRAKLLREALSDDAEAPRYVESVRGRGYRLAVAVETVATDFTHELSENNDSAPRHSTPSGPRDRVQRITILALGIGAALLLLLRIPDDGAQQKSGANAVSRQPGARSAGKSVESSSVVVLPFLSISDDPRGESSQMASRRKSSVHSPRYADSMSYRVHHLSRSSTVICRHP